MTKKHGIQAVAASIAIQLTLGTAYIWSLFQDGLTYSVFGGNNRSAALTFSVMLATLTIGSVFGGKLALKYGTRTAVFTGGLIASTGFVIASFVQAEFAWLLWISYGLMGGVGLGFTYSTTIACVQRWYPHKKGLVTGIIVSALGFGGVVFTPIVEWLIQDLFGGQGVGEFNAFRVLAGVFLVVCSVGSLFLKNPPEGWMAEAVAAAPRAKVVRNYTPGEMLKSGKFYLVIATFALACMGGLMMIAFARPIAVARGFEGIAAMGVLMISMFNSVGRLLWGFVSDKIGRKNTLMLMLAGSAVLSLLVGFVDGVGIFVLIAFIGLFYGGILGTFPSLTADLFGAKHQATNYGFVLLGFGAGAIISTEISGHFRNVAAYYDDIERMFPAFVIASACALAGVAMMLALKALRKKETANGEA